MCEMFMKDERRQNWARSKRNCKAGLRVPLPAWCAPVPESSLSPVPPRPPSWDAGAPERRLSARRLSAAKAAAASTLLLLPLAQT